MSIKLVSWNVNGIRAVSKKEDFWNWFDNTDADIINFQEVRATEKQIPKKLANIDDFHKFYNSAEKKGYSGVGTYSKIEPIGITRGLGVEELDNEGRVLKIEYPDFILFNIYFPNSGKDGIRLGFKIDFCNELLNQLIQLKEEGFVDTFRIFDKGEGNFTWWSYRFKARERNSGWRLDYFYVNEEMVDKVKSAKILSDIYGSDHCPVTLELDF